MQTGRSAYLRRMATTILLTGAAGFIGSALLRYLNDRGHTDVVLVDDFSRSDKQPNLAGKAYTEKVARDHLDPWLAAHGDRIGFVYHLGARTDTTEQDRTIFDRLNVAYSQRLWRFCTERQIPLVYASSAATYGLGEHGYDDRHDVVDRLRPLNPYGDSKNDFDKWALAQAAAPPRWAGLKFFNVYGPNEYHKGRMASVILHTARQIKQTGAMRLFRSHRADVADGAQSRDFIYVKDVVAMCHFFQTHTPPSGLYNVGTGQARTFYDLAAATFRAMGQAPQISFIDTPADIRDTYQYFTEANMDKLRAAGYTAETYSLEAGVADYVGTYLGAEVVW